MLSSCGQPDRRARCAPGRPHRPGPAPPGGVPCRRPATLTISETARETIVRDADTLRAAATSRRLRAYRGLPRSALTEQSPRSRETTDRSGFWTCARAFSLAPRSGTTAPWRAWRSARTDTAGHRRRRRRPVIVWDPSRATPRNVREPRTHRASRSHRTGERLQCEPGRHVIAWDGAGSRRLGRMFAATSRSRSGRSSPSGDPPRNIGAYNFATTPDGAR